MAARDKLGRLPVLIGRNEDGYCVCFESFAYKKLGYETEFIRENRDPKLNKYFLKKAL